MNKYTYEVQSVEKRDVNDHGHNWVVTANRSDGERFTFAIPSFTWAGKAAEYGIPLEDIDTLMDVTIHDMLGGIDEFHPDFVFNNDEKTAREKLIARVADIKTRHLVTDPENLFQEIRGHHMHTPHADFHKRHCERAQSIRKARKI